MQSELRTQYLTHRKVVEGVLSQEQTVAQSARSEAEAVAEAKNLLYRSCRTRSIFCLVDASVQTEQQES